MRGPAAPPRCRGGALPPRRPPRGPARPGAARPGPGRASGSSPRLSYSQKRSDTLPPGLVVMCAFVQWGVGWGGSAGGAALEKGALPSCAGMDGRFALGSYSVGGAFRHDRTRTLKVVRLASHRQCATECSMPWRSYPETCAGAGGGGRGQARHCWVRGCLAQGSGGGGARSRRAASRLAHHTAAARCLLRAASAAARPRPPKPRRTCSRKGGWSLLMDRQRQSCCSVSVPEGQMPSSRCLSSCQRGGTPGAEAGAGAGRGGGREAEPGSAQPGGRCLQAWPGALRTTATPHAAPLPLAAPAGAGPRRAPRRPAPPPRGLPGMAPT